MQPLKKFIKTEYIILAAIIFAAVFLRSYQHEKFLSFQLDQSRDALIVGNFVDGGLKNIPLLGPHITGSSLQLGPAYYYILSVPAYFWKTGPESFALPEMLFSIFFVPLLYFFLRLYFSKFISLSVSAVAAVSLFLVIYGRFAWNPNSLPFFTLLALFGLLKSDWKNTVRPGWFYLGIFGAAIATQLHYIYFFMAPVLISAYLVFSRPKLKIKHYFVAFFIVFAVYLPEIISETQTGGANTRSLFENTLEKVPDANAKNRHNLFDKTFYAFQKLEITNWQMITSDEHGSSIALSKKFTPVCNRQCRKELPFLALATILFIFGLWAGIGTFFREKDRDRKKYVFASLAWLGLMLAISVPLIYKMSPYYYLAAVPPLFVLLGLSLEKIKKASEKYGFASAVFLSAAIIFFNLKSDFIYFYQRKALAEREVENTVGREFYDDRKVTLEQMEKAAGYIEKHKHSEAVVRVAADNTFARAVVYLLNHEKKIPSCYIKTSSFHPSGGVDYFLVYRVSVNDHMPEDLNEQFQIRSQEKFGNLLVIDIEAKNPEAEMTESEKNCFVL